jgi:hypothetical protein
MPTVLSVAPFRFFFYAGDGSESPHVHIERAGAWLGREAVSRAKAFRGRRHRSSAEPDGGVSK